MARALASVKAAGTKWHWGVDTSISLTATVDGMSLPDRVHQVSGHRPAFWGRYLTGGQIDLLDRAEVAAMRGDARLHFPLLLLHGATTSASVQGSGVLEAQAAIHAARTLQIPEGKGIAIFGDVESDMRPTVEWIVGWAQEFARSGYRCGLYANATRDYLVAAYNEAFAQEAAVQKMFFYASHLEKEPRPAAPWCTGQIPTPFAEDGFPTMPSCLDNVTHRGQLVVWQYVENCDPIPNSDPPDGRFDYDLISDLGLTLTWLP